MKYLKTSICMLIITCLTYSQTPYTVINDGLSIALSDNTDALNLNPAGLGVNRGYQMAMHVQQYNLFDEDNKNVYNFSYTQRWESGFSFQHEYNEIDKYRWSIGFGTDLGNNVYAGIKFHKNKFNNMTHHNYALGALYRPFNFISVGSTLYTDTEDTYRYSRDGLAIRPFSINNKSTINKNTFIGYSNLTIGYDRLTSFDSEWKENNHEDYIFINFDLIPGFNVGINKYSGDSFSMNLSLNVGNKGVQFNSYPSSSFYGNNSATTNGIGVFEHSQTQNSEVNYPYGSDNNFVWIDLDAYFIEENPSDKPFFDFDIQLPFIGGNSYPDAIQLKTFIDQINELTYNDSVNGMVIKLNTVVAGFGKRKEIYNALINFKNSGKKIIVYSENYISNLDYYLLSMADEIYTSKMSGIELKGISMEMMFVRGLLDTLNITPEVIRVSPYKTAGDMLLNKEASKEMKENYNVLLDDLFDIMVNDISTARNWSKELTVEHINNGPFYNSDEAIANGMITGTMYPDDFKNYIDTLKINDDNINIIKWNDFEPSSMYIHDWVPDETPKIAIIYAVGGIISGESNPGPQGSTVMGDITIKRAIKEARENKSVKAIILRIDSGGGSALASDMMWKEVRNTTDPNSENHKPVVVSMSDVAASGGYYIACDADEIIAGPTTITGSIGVIFVRLNFTKLLNKIGITYDGLKRGDKADFGSMSHLMTEEESKRFLEEINHSYLIFKEKVIEGRDNLNDIDALDDIALGRVWSGNTALENGLIDRIGGLHDAIDAAKDKANIIVDADIEILEYPKQNSFSFLDLFSDNNQEMTILELTDILPSELAQELEVLQLVPVLINNEIQFLMPYTIEIN